ncbi:FkbM family methyltransferase [Aridibaculum aurantiacum]|uniref:FkbM family methyltransferase n=1 Tax=Aridibaculum aurantiacum TaxID=2810307 RepID=UPI001A9773EE|nr:FkbM family methyltransferase [Aridibaculum aurantiacum]
MSVRNFLKKIAALLPFPLTKNEYYDRLTERVIRRVCKADSTCVDVGANEGKILALFIRHCPASMHYAFEPIPFLYHKLKRRYSSAAHIHPLAISNKSGTSSFNYVITDPAYSGLLKRPYDKPEKDEIIEVATATLDEVIPASEKIDLVKLDIEGGEYHALQGASNLLQAHHPHILFEFGKGGSDAYGITPAMMYAFLKSKNYRLNTLPRFLSNKPPLTHPQFEQHFHKRSTFFFIAFHG